MLSRKQGLFAACPSVHQTIARSDNDIGFEQMASISGMTYSGLRIRDRGGLWNAIVQDCLELVVISKPKPHAIQRDLESPTASAQFRRSLGWTGWV
jgi:hypothetical protein